jgi:hypothetical protein
MTIFPQFFIRFQFKTDHWFWMSSWDRKLFKCARFASQNRNPGTYLTGSQIDVGDDRKPKRYIIKYQLIFSAWLKTF